MKKKTRAMIAMRVATIFGLLILSVLPAHADDWTDGTGYFHEQAQRVAHLPLTPLSKEELRAKGRLTEAQEGQRTVFTTQNFATGGSEPVTATLRAVGRHCYVYLADGYTMSDSTIEGIRREFDENVHPKLTSFFGSEWSPGIDFDPRVTLLLLDIKDGWTPGQGYIAGYFSPIDEYSTRLFPGSNEREMLYMDIFPAQAGSAAFLGTLAHEFAHMIHFNQDRREDKWLNEGLAQLASYKAGYGHPNQIFSFIENPHAPLGQWAGSVIDYGGSYLWFYYLHEKVASKAAQGPGAFFKDLISSGEIGVDSVRTVLGKHRPDLKLEDVFADWSVATFLNRPDQGEGRYGYDETMPLVAREGTTIQGLASEVRGKQQLSSWSATTLFFTPEQLWSPRSPNVASEVTFYSPTPGDVRWTVNAGVRPPDALMPEGSRVSDDGRAVITPMEGPDGSGRYQAVIGPFYMARGLKVERVNFSVLGAGGAAAERSIPITHLGGVRDGDEAEAGFRGPVRFEFDGDSGFLGIARKEFRLLAVVERSGGRMTVDNVDLSRWNNGTFTYEANFADVTAVTFVPVNVGKRDAKFGFKTRRQEPAPDPDPQLPPGFPTNDELKAAIGINPVALELSMAAPDSDLYQKKLAELAVDPEKLTLFVTAAGKVDPVQRGRLGGFFRDLLRVVNDEITGGGISVEPHVLESLRKLTEGVVFDGETGDDGSHSNIPYLISKCREIVDALAHRKLDPFGFEGSILKTLEALKAMGRIPNIPLPRGLSPKSYDVAAATALLDTWAQGTGDAAEEEERRQVLYRMILSEGLVEFAYDTGTIMADDALVDLYRLVTFANTARSVTGILALKAKNIPIAGELLQRLQRAISSQILSIVARVTRYVAARLPEPYGGIIQYVAQILFWGYAQAKGLGLDYWDTWVMEYVVKMVGKLVLVSVPKVGYVAVGQPAVDRGVELATAGVHQGQLRQAQFKLAEHHNRIAGQIVHRHGAALTSRQVTDVLGRISDVTRIGILLDPTKITTVLSIGTSILAGGVYVHSLVRSATYLYNLPRKDLRRAVTDVFYPVAPPGDTGAEENAPVHGTWAISAPVPMAGEWAQAVDEARGIFRRYESTSRLDPEQLRTDVLRLIELEGRFQEMAHTLDRLRDASDAGSLEAGLDGEDPTEADRELSEAMVADLTRLEGVAGLALLPISAGEGSIDAAAKGTLRRARSALDALAARLETVSRLAEGRLERPVLVVRGVSVEGEDSTRTLSLEVTNPMDRDVSDVTLHFETAFQVGVAGGATQELGSLAPGETRTVELDLDLSREEIRPIPARVAITTGPVEAAGYPIVLE